MKKIEELDLKNKKYIIFDMDGTLIDSIGIWNAVDYAIIKELTGREVDFFFIQQNRDLFLETHTQGDIYLEYCKDLIEKYALEISKENLLKLRWKVSSEYLEKKVDFKPGVVDLLKYLKKEGFILVLATTTSNVQLEIYANKNFKMMSQLKIKDYFDLILTKEDIKNQKPHSEIYFRILEYYHTTPEECLVFEDSLHGIISAKGGYDGNSTYQ